MKAIEYFKYGLNHDFWLYRKWFFKILSISPNEFEKNEWFKIEDRKYKVLINEEYVEIEDRDASEALIRISDYISLKDINMKNITNPNDTSRVGIVIANKILIESIFGEKHPFINGEVKYGDIEKFIAGGLLDGKVTIEDYENFIIAKGFLETFSRLVTISATPKGLLPPTGIKEFKKKLREEFNKKYGPNWDDDFTHVAEFEAEIKKYDAEFLKDDPANNKFLSGKVKNEARRKMFLAFGAELGFKSNTDPANMVETSLLDDYPKDPEQLATMFNSARNGSYKRGIETQQGGVVAKDALRSTSSINIVKGDCKTKLTDDILITEENYINYLKRNIVVNGKIVTMDNPGDYIGKIVKLRTPIYCKSKGSTFCSVCAGELMKNYEKGVSLLISKIAGIILNTAMKSMHTSALSTIEFDLLDAIE